MTIPSFYKAAACKQYTAWMFTQNACWFYQPKWLDNNFYIDAFTVEPEKQFCAQQAVWPKGVPLPVVESHFAGAKPGSVPHIMVYMGNHRQFGSVPLFLIHGMKGGGKQALKFLANGMYAGCITWLDQLTPEEQDSLRKVHYCNQPKALKKWCNKATTTDDDKEDMACGPIDSKFFLVCTHSDLPQSRAQLHQVEHTADLTSL